MAVHDGLAWTRRPLESIARHTGGPYEVVVADNGSGPETCEYLRATGARVFRNEVNRGCAAAWNQRVAAPRGTHVCLVNSDVEGPAGRLDRPVAFHRAHRFAWVSPAIREGPLDSDLEALNRRVRARAGHRCFPDEFRGMVLFSRRDLYDAVGGFDEGFAFAKDEDMAWRLRPSGPRAAVTLSVVVHHHGRRTVRAERRRVPDFEARSTRYFDQQWRAARLRRKGWKLASRRDGSSDAWPGAPATDRGPGPRAAVGPRGRDDRRRSARTPSTAHVGPGGRRPSPPRRPALSPRPARCPETEGRRPSRVSPAIIAPHRPPTAAEGGAT
jgi:GT2 family glycosyltransferase